MQSLKGTLTALVTPFRDGALDAAALESLIQRQLDVGVDGLVPCGTTGESPTLTEAEYHRVITTSVKLAAGRVPVVAGAGTNSTRGTIDRVHVCGECGADALLVVSPYYNKPSQQGLYQHFAAVAQSTTLPIVLYNIPGRTGVELSVDTITRLHADHANIVSVKHATGSVAGAVDLLAACSIAMLSGDDPLTLPLMSLGALGVISAMSNLVPRTIKRLTDAMLADDLPAARLVHRQMYPLVKLLATLDTNPIPVKTALAIRGLCAEEFRLPLCPMSPDSRRRLEAQLEQSELD